MADRFLRFLFAEIIGLGIGLLGVLVEVVMEGEEGFDVLLLGFVCGLISWFLGLAVVSLISRKSKIAAVIYFILQISLTIYCLAEYGIECIIEMTSIGGVVLASMFMSIVNLFVLYKFICESGEPQKGQTSLNKKFQTRPTVQQAKPSKQRVNNHYTSLDVDNFRMVVISVSSKSLYTMSVHGRIVDGGVATGDKVYFYRGDQLIVAEKVLKLEVKGQPRQTAVQGETVDLIIKWSSIEHFNRCTSVRNSKI